MAAESRYKMSQERLDELKQELLFHSSGETASITVWRSGEYLELSITFDEAPAETGTDSGSGNVEQTYPWSQSGGLFG